MLGGIFDSLFPAQKVIYYSIKFNRKKECANIKYSEKKSKCVSLTLLLLPFDPKTDRPDLINDLIKVLVIINVYKTLVFRHVQFQDVNNIDNNYHHLLSTQYVPSIWYIIHFHYFIKSSQGLMKEMWSYPLYRLGNWGFDRLSSPGDLISYGFNLVYLSLEPHTFIQLLI